MRTQLSPPPAISSLLVAGHDHELAVVRDDLDADQQALAAHVDDDVREAVLQAVQLLFQIAGDLVDVVDQFGLDRSPKAA
jgi:hypothetical protein